MSPVLRRVQQQSTAGGGQDSCSDPASTPVKPRSPESVRRRTCKARSDLTRRNSSFGPPPGRRRSRAARSSPRRPRRYHYGGSICSAAQASAVGHDRLTWDSRRATGFAARAPRVCLLTVFRRLAEQAGRRHWDDGWNSRRDSGGSDLRQANVRELCCGAADRKRRGVQLGDNNGDDHPAGARVHGRLPAVVPPQPEPPCSPDAVFRGNQDQAAPA